MGNSQVDAWHLKQRPDWSRHPVALRQWVTKDGLSSFSVLMVHTTGVRRHGLRRLMENWSMERGCFWLGCSNSNLLPQPLAKRHPNLMQRANRNRHGICSAHFTFHPSGVTFLEGWVPLCFSSTDQIRRTWAPWVLIDRYPVCIVSWTINVVLPLTNRTTYCRASTTANLISASVMITED